jgi:hypothetical protein
VKIIPTSVNLADVLADELDELRAIHPERQIELHMSGDQSIQQELLRFLLR